MTRAPALALLALLAAPADAFDALQFLEPSLDAKQAGRGVAVAASPDRIYLADDKKNALHIYSSDGKFLNTVSGLFSKPQGVAVGPDGEVYVADTGNSRIQVLDAAGKLLRAIGAGGSDPGQLSKPASVAVGADGRVYVSDTGNDRVQVYTREGVFLFGFGGKGKENGLFNAPGRIQITLSDHVYVLDEGNDRVQKFNPDTTFAKEYALHGADFAVDAYGFLYMLDFKREDVKEIGPDGIVLGRFGSSGKGKTQFKKPRAIAISPDGTILVSDSGNDRIQRVRLTSKAKVRPLPHNLATKLLVTGPRWSVNLEASALGGLAGEVYAYSLKEKKFVIIGKDGKKRLSFAGTQDAQTRSSLGIAVSAQHGLFSSDSKEDRIQSFNLDGVHRMNFGETKGFLASKTKEGRVKGPQGLLVNPEGTVYVADTGNKRVDAFGPDGTFQFSFGPIVGPEELDKPSALAWDKAGYIYVLDRGLKKVFKCEPSGGYIKAWGGEGDTVDRFSDPVALAYDERSYLYVLDQGHKRVAVFDRDGKWVTNFFSGGLDERSLSEPNALAVLGDMLVISDSDRGRLTSFELHPRLAPPVEISTKAVEGVVVLKWPALDDPWVKRYRVYRSSGAFGPFAEAGASDKPGFTDSKVEAYQTYHYRVAAEAHTGDLGPESLPVEAFIPGSFNQAPLEISTISIGNIFSANYKWYLKNPLGEAVIVNNVNLPFKNVKVSFRLKDFMDFATEKVLAEVGAKETVRVPLAATLNNKILEVSEDTPIQAEVTLTYHEKGKKAELSQALPLKVYSGNAITWEDPRRVANYITPKDPPVLDLGREIQRQASDGPPGSATLNANLVIALRMWSALGSLGVKFLPSPNNPFVEMSEDPSFPVDYTQFPRETLRRRSGECDDLVTLLSSLLEGAAVRTAVIDYPGHLAMMFDAGSSDTMELGLPKDRLIEYDGSSWIALEATMLGSPMSEAARKALHAYKEMAAKGDAKIIDPRKSWEIYEPATLPPPTQEPLTPDAAESGKRFDSEAEAYIKERYAHLNGHLGERAKAEGETVELLNLFGILEVQHANPGEARKRFAAALEADPGDAAALNNLGSLAFVDGRFEEAFERYRKAADQDSEDAGVWMNLARAALKLGRRAEAEEFTRNAVQLDGGLKPAVENLLKP